MTRREASRSIQYRAIRSRRRGRSWQVDSGWRKGCRVQRSFKNKDAAKQEIDQHWAREAPEVEDLRNNPVTLPSDTARTC